MHFFEVVLLLQVGVVLQGVGAQSWLLGMKDALEHGLQFDTRLSTVAFTVPKLWLFSSEQTQIDFFVLRFFVGIIN